MSDSFLDQLSSPEREKIRKKLRSPAAYERLREKVKGPEDLEAELKRAEQIADLHFALESDHAMYQKLKMDVQRAITDRGIEHVLGDKVDISIDVRRKLEGGKFDVAVSTHPTTHEDAIVLIPEGNVKDALPLTSQLTNALASSLSHDER
jgi:hypothetical protein